MEASGERRLIWGAGAGLKGTQIIFETAASAAQIGGSSIATFRLDLFFQIVRRHDNGPHLPVLLMAIDRMARSALAMHNEAMTCDDLDKLAEGALQAGHGMTKPASE
jgi:hypothetical protein